MMMKDLKNCGDENQVVKVSENSTTIVNDKCEVFSHTCANVKTYGKADVNFYFYFHKFILSNSFNQAVITIKKNRMVLYNGTENLCRKRKVQNELSLVMMSVCGLRCSMAAVKLKISLKCLFSYHKFSHLEFVLRWRQENRHIQCQQENVRFGWWRLTFHSCCCQTWYGIVMLWVRTQLETTLNSTISVNYCHVDNQIKLWTKKLIFWINDLRIITKWMFVDFDELRYLIQCVTVTLTGISCTKWKQNQFWFFMCWCFCAYQCQSMQDHV
jgi:hypothetical protein